MHIRRLVIGILTVLAAAFLSAIIFYVWLYSVAFPQTMSAFAGLWNTTDALTSYVYQEKQWPNEWDDLKFVAPFYDEDDVSFAKEQVEVNFSIDFSALPKDDDWYVRVKSGRILPEQQNANQRIRDTILALRKQTQTSVETVE